MRCLIKVKRHYTPAKMEIKNLISGSIPMSVRSNKRVTAGATNGRIRANAEAKIMARMQHDIAYIGSYTPG